jgi:hypothetical protein
LVKENDIFTRNRFTIYRLDSNAYLYYNHVRNRKEKEEEMKEFLLAIAISMLLICGIVLTDYPEKWFQHGMKCDGSIGGGCVCTEESRSFLCK